MCVGEAIEVTIKDFLGEETVNGNVGLPDAYRDESGEIMFEGLKCVETVGTIFVLSDICLEGLVNISREDFTNVEIVDAIDGLSDISIGKSANATFDGSTYVVVESVAFTAVKAVDPTDEVAVEVDIMFERFADFMTGAIDCFTNVMALEEVEGYPCVEEVLACGGKSYVCAYVALTTFDRVVATARGGIGKE